MTSLYINVFLPLNFRDTVTYALPPELGRVVTGSYVLVPIKDELYQGIVSDIGIQPDYDASKIRPVAQILPVPPVPAVQMKFLKALADYYMCSMGEVLMGLPFDFSKLNRKQQESLRSGSEDAKEAGALEPKQPISLSEAQQEACEQITKAHKEGKCALLQGVTGSGKTEIYFSLMAKTLAEGKNAVLMVPEVALSSQLSHRCSEVFGDRLFVFHSRQTLLKRNELILRLLRQQAGTDKKGPIVIIGLRSVMMLPLSNVGLFVIDEEHDSSFKQTDHAPRFHGRDAALLYAGICGAKVLLGSATPSFESLYNASTGKFAHVFLDRSYYQSPGVKVLLVDMIKRKRQNAVMDCLSLDLIREISKRLERGEQVMVFRSRRAYSPMVQCSECGEIPLCRHCNTHLTYHRFNRRLSCHICGYGRYADTCPSCGAKDSLKPLGEGTERIEEILREHFPTARIARLDSDTSKRDSEQKAILKAFSEGETDILVGTQMITKGFDFPKLSMAAVIHGESLTTGTDFRSDEKAFQLLCQLRGRTGRRDKEGLLLIQASQSAKPVYQALLAGGAVNTGLPWYIERGTNGLPPFTRQISLTVKEYRQEKCQERAAEIRGLVDRAGFTDVVGPYSPPLERSHGTWILRIDIFHKRSQAALAAKARLWELLRTLSKPPIIDVDPIS